MDPTTPVIPGTTAPSVTTTTVVIEKPARRPSVPVKERAREVQHKLEQFCADDPIKAMAIALAAGWVCGKLLGALVHRDVDKEMKERRKLVAKLRKKDRKWHEDYLLKDILVEE